VRRLIESTDVVVENFREGVMQRWGLDYETLAVEQPALVYCSITGFGSTGPLAQRAANDLIVQAYSGLLSMTGEVGGPPVRCGTAVCDFSAGYSAALGVVSALLHRERTGQGQRVETSMLESQISIMSYFFADYWLRGTVPHAMGTANSLGMPNQVFPAKDGWVAITAANDAMWERCCAALGQPGLARDSRFATLADRYQNRDELVEVLSGIITHFDTSDCVRRLEEHGVSCAQINTLDQVAAGDQIGALGLAVDVGYDGGVHRAIGNPLHFSRTPWTVRAPVPRLGENSRQIAASLGYGDAEIDELIDSGVLGCS
jgi:glutaryl-CoA transferase